MKRATVTVPEDLDAPIEAFCRDQDVPPPFTAVVQAALREYLRNRGYISPSEPFALTPAEHGRNRRERLRRWATWTEEEASAFDDIVKSQRVVDADLWR